MSFAAACPGCLMGNHERHERDWNISPGLIGGSSCDCTGDCRITPTPDVLASDTATKVDALAFDNPLSDLDRARLCTMLDVWHAAHEAQIRDLLEEREELLTEIRRLRMGNHPAGRALHTADYDVAALDLRHALTERDAEHEGGEGA